MKGKRIVVAAAVLILAIIGMVIATGKQEVRAVKAEKGVISRQVKETALVQPADDIKLYATQNARVMELLTEIGQKVEKGQVLLKLDNPDLELQLTQVKTALAQAQSSITSAQSGVKQLETELDNARTELKRTESLFKQGAVSKSEYEKAVLAVESIQSGLNQQQSLLETAGSQAQGLGTQIKQLEERTGELIITSPIEGTILELPVKSEQPVMPGTLLAAVGSSQNLEIKADILSDDLADVKVGQNVIITAPVLVEKELPGEVVQIYPRAEEKVSALGVIQRRVPVIIKMENSANLQPGYEVRVAIETARLENVLVLPLESVRSLLDNQKQVMLIKDGRIVFEKVEIGLIDSNNMQITGGLEEGDLVVQDANLDLKENARVKALK